MKILRTLIVDDHLAFRNSLRKMLADFSFIQVVGEAASAEEALDAVERDHPHLVIEDIRLPGMDGFELARLLRVRAPGTRVILISLYGNPAYSQEAERLGVPLIPKQWMMAELPEALEEINRESNGRNAGRTRDASSATDHSVSPSKKNTKVGTAQ